jgi:hypothetical protein
MCVTFDVNVCDFYIENARFPTLVAKLATIPNEQQFARSVR